MQIFLLIQDIRENVIRKGKIDKVLYTMPMYKRFDELATI